MGEVTEVLVCRLATEMSNTRTGLAFDVVKLFTEGKVLHFEKLQNFF